MKLKKIASLALAGLMAVGMLAGCSGNGGNNGNGGENTGAANLSSEVVTAVKADASLKKGLSISAGADYTEQLKAFVKKYGDDQKTAATALNNFEIKFGGDQSSLSSEFKTYIKADSDSIGAGLMTALDEEYVGTTVTASNLYVVNASVDDDLITDMVADLIVAVSNTAGYPVKDSIDSKDNKNKVPVTYSYTVSVATVEDSVDYTYAVGSVGAVETDGETGALIGAGVNGGTVKYVSVVVTAKASM